MCKSFVLNFIGLVGMYHREYDYFKIVPFFHNQPVACANRDKIKEKKIICVERVEPFANAFAFIDANYMVFYSNLHETSKSKL